MLDPRALLRLTGKVTRYFDGRIRYDMDRDTFELALDMIAEGSSLKETAEYLKIPTSTAILAKNQPIEDWERA